jgi:hypothetical protein
MKNNNDYAKLLKELEESRLKNEYQAQIRAKVEYRKNNEFLYKAKNPFDLRPKSIIKSVKFEILIFGLGILGIIGTFYFLKENQKQNLDNKFTKKAVKYDLTDRSFMQNKLIEESRKMKEIIKNDLNEWD